MSKQKNLEICNEIVHSGELANFAMPLPEKYSCAPLYMPIKVIHGVKPGPKILIFSVLKGNEFNGLEICSRIIKQIKPKDISGTILVVPVLNIYGLTNYPNRYTNETELINCFPGSENGSYNQRIANIFTQELLKKVDYCIGLQTGDLHYNILPQVYCNLDNLRIKNLALAFQVPVVSNIMAKQNSLSKVAEELHIPLLIYQAGEGMRFDENSISLGTAGIVNIMKTLKMLPENPTKGIKSIFSRNEHWLKSNNAGILHSHVALGQTINKNETIGTISDPFGANIVESIKSDKKGLIIGINTSPLIQEGLSLFKLASFLDYEKAETFIGEWDKNQPDSFIE